MKYLLTCFFFFVLGWRCFATGNNERMLLHTDSLMTTFNTEGQCFLKHVVASGQTLYSLAKFYNVNIEELKRLNPNIESNWVPGKGFAVPLAKRASIPFKTADFIRWKWAPMFHKVAAGETLFRISKNYGVPLDSLRARNVIAPTGIANGQLLHVGWFSTAGVPALPATTTVVQSEEVQKLKAENLAMRQLFDVQKAASTPIERTGPSIWNRSGKGGLFVLHNEAAIGSSMQLFNPQTRRFLYAKVIGRIPEGAQDNSIIVVMSENVGKYLGCVDKKVFLKIKYTR